MTLSLSRMPLKNLCAHPARTAVLLLLAAAQAACVFGGAMLAGASRAELDLARERLGADVIIYPYEASYAIDMDELIMQGTPVAAYAPRSQLARVDDCDGIAAVTHQVYVPGPSDGPAWVIGFDADTDFVLAPWVAEGPDYALPAGNALVGANVDAASGEAEVYGRSWPVAAHLRETGSALDDAVFLSMGDLRTVVADAQAAGVREVAGLDPVSDYSALLIRVDEGADIESVANWLKVYVSKTKAVRNDAALEGTSAGIGWQSLAVGGAAAAAWVVLLAALAVAQSMAVRERAGELFVWRAAGASRKAVRRVVVREAVMANAAGALIGVIVAAAAVALAGVAGLPLPAVFSVAAAAIALSTLAGWVVTALTVRRALESSGGQMLVAA